MKHKQNGFGVLSLLLVLVIFGAVGGTGWYVYKNSAAKNDSKEAVVATADPSETAKSVAAVPPKLDEQKVPAGWRVDQNETGSIVLTRIETGCAAGVTYSTDTLESNAPTLDHFQQVIDSMKSKGYTVKASEATLTVHTASGDKTLKAQNMKVDGQNADLAQRYAFVSNTQYYEGFQLSCAHEADLPTAQAALLAITVTEVK